MGNIIDDFQHSGGQKDGADGKPFGTSGDPFSGKYSEGYDAGKYDYDKKKYGETFARILKADRDFGKNIERCSKPQSKKQPKEELSYTPSPEPEEEYCPVCGDVLEDGYCYYCEEEEEEYYEELAKKKEIEREKARKRRKEIDEKLKGKSVWGLENLLLFDSDLEEDVKLEIIRRMDSSNIYNLEFTVQYDESSSVRAATIDRLKELGREIPEVISDELLREAGTTRSNLRFYKLMSDHETNPALRKDAYDHVKQIEKRIFNILQERREKQAEVRRKQVASNYISGAVKLTLTGLVLLGAAYIGNKAHKYYKIPKENIIRQSWYARGLAKDTEEKVRYQNSSVLQRPEFHEVEKGIISLVKELRKKGAWPIIRDYAKKENNLWVAGQAYINSKGFICYSPDMGKNWFVQWRQPKTDNYDNPIRVYFHDNLEGWAYTNKRVLHTINGGKTWKNSIYGEDRVLVRLHIIDRNTLIAEDYSTGPDEDETLYITNNRGEKWFRYDKNIPVFNKWRAWLSKSGEDISFYNESTMR